MKYLMETKNEDGLRAFQLKTDRARHIAEKGGKTIQRGKAEKKYGAYAVFAARLNFKRAL